MDILMTTCSKPPASNETPSCEMLLFSSQRVVIQGNPDKSFCPTSPVGSQRIQRASRHEQALNTSPSISNLTQCLVTHIKIQICNLNATTVMQIHKTDLGLALLVGKKASSTQLLVTLSLCSADELTSDISGSSDCRSFSQKLHCCCRQFLISILLCCSVQRDQISYL
eukprot:762090-Hanusia_phi.AAC.1